MPAHSALNDKAFFAKRFAIFNKMGCHFFVSYFLFKKNNLYSHNINPIINIIFDVKNQIIVYLWNEKIKNDFYLLKEQSG